MRMNGTVYFKRLTVVFSYFFCNTRPRRIAGVMYIALKYTLLQLMITKKSMHFLIFVLLNYLKFFFFYVTKQDLKLLKMYWLYILNICVICMFLAHGSREWNSIYQVLPQRCKDSRLIDIPSLRGQDSGRGPVHSGGTGLWKGNLVFPFLNYVIFPLFSFLFLLRFIV